ncbi:MFS transporter [Catenulispora yoronensis]|uniref:MFS transporter n=1 Tax=Catenulispora yoronensis TaxID=450799 RepID=A0ABP5GJS7_9ACTN
MLAVPGLAALLGVSLVARAALAANMMTLTLYVVLGLHMDYSAAGGVAAALTTGLALGGPLLGRLVDRRGARVVLLFTAAAQIVFWASVPALPFPLLVVAAFWAGLLMVPSPLVIRQALAAMTTAGQRRAAFALESVQGELSYVLGPPIVILGVAVASPRAVAWGVGAVIAIGGAGIAVLDPPLRGENEVEADRAARPRRREWLGPGMIAALLMAFGATVLLSGTELAIVATLKAVGQVSWAGVVVAVYGVSSIVGGLVYGTLSRPLPTWLLLAGLGVLTAPAGLAHSWAWLCVAGVGAGLLTAPTLSCVAATVSRLAPPSARGEATGLQSSALSAGFAIGAPVVGGVIDMSAPAAGFAASGLVAVVAALMGYLVGRRQENQRSQAAHRRGRPRTAGRRSWSSVGKA